MTMLNLLSIGLLHLALAPGALLKAGWACMLLVDGLARFPACFKAAAYVGTLPLVPLL